MAVSDAQKVDLLYKKLFGVTKTDNSTNKSPSNESIASPAFLRGDTIWTQSTLIPNVAANVTSVVRAYNNAGAVQCAADTTSTPIGSVYPSWKTNLINWVPPEFGATYLVKVYAAAANVANVESTGTQLFAAGSGGTGEWYFDPVAGVLNFIGQTIPAALTTSNVIYISGYRYIGTTGVASNLSGSFGNINIANNSITSTNTNGNINLTPNGIGITAVTGNLTVSNTLTVIGNIATANYFVGNFAGNVSGNITAPGSSTQVLFNDAGTTSATSGFTFDKITGLVSIGGNLVINGNGSIVLPQGTDSQRPSAANAGMFRFSTTTNKVEWYTGSAWQAPITSYTQITSNAQTADGTSVSYPMPVANATTAGTVISINGIVQQPIASYSITGNSIVFTEAPLASDVVDIRVFTTTESITSVADMFGNTGIFFDRTSGDQIIHIKSAGTDSATFQPNGQFRLLGNIRSNSYTTGQMVITGGMGVSGNVYVNDTLYAVAKSFLIDHPSKPDYKLQYTCLEGPENGVYVRGRIKDKNVIELPDYWVDLVDDTTITVDLTPVGEFQQLYVAKINNNKIFVKNTLGTTCNCFYTVWAERKDIEKLKVEYPK